MTAFASLLVCLTIFVGSHLTSAARRIPEGEYCPMCDYVFTDDGAFGYTLMETHNRSEDLGIPVTTYMINMTSQRWKDESWTLRPLWWHVLAVNVPHEITNTEHGLLYVSGGSNRDDPPYNKNNVHIFRTVQLASRLGIPSGAVFQIPNQPLVYTDDSAQQERWEDDLMAYSEREFADMEANNPPGDPEMLLKVAMVKGTVRALDAIQAFVNEDLGVAAIEKFFMAGQSKRGFATWMGSTIDDRVVGMVPTVLTDLNFIPTLHHYYPSMEGWPIWWGDYYNYGLLGRLDNPEAPVIYSIIDAHYYRDYMDFPKLIVAGASDEFFLPSDSHYFFPDLIGEKYMWIVENCGHSVEASPSSQDYWNMIAAFFEAIMLDIARPVFDWIAETPEDRTGTASLTVTSETAPASITAFSAQSVVPDRRDWRAIMACDDNEGCYTKPTDIVWEPKEVLDLGGGQYEVTYDVPQEGYLAFFIKLEYESQTRTRNFIFTTEVVVTPNSFPYDECYGANCTGRLV